MTKILVLAFLLLVCTGASCPSKDQLGYQYWVPDPKHDILQAHDPKDDVSLSQTCSPTETNRAPCVVFATEVYRALYKELLENRAALSACQKGAPPANP